MRWDAHSSSSFLVLCALFWSDLAAAAARPARRAPSLTAASLRAPSRSHAEQSSGTAYRQPARAKERAPISFRHQPNGLLGVGFLGSSTAAASFDQ